MTECSRMGSCVCYVCGGGKRGTTRRLQWFFRLATFTFEKNAHFFACSSCRVCVCVNVAERCVWNDWNRCWFVPLAPLTSSNTFYTRHLYIEKGIGIKIVERGGKEKIIRLNEVTATTTTTIPQSHTFLNRNTSPFPYKKDFTIKNIYWAVSFKLFGVRPKKAERKWLCAEEKHYYTDRPFLSHAWLHPFAIATVQHLGFKSFFPAPQ